LESRLALPTTAAVFILVMVMAVAVFAAEPPQVVARGDDGIEVTAADLGAMRATAPDFVPTRKALVEATVRTVLFARESVPVSCAAAAEKSGFARRLALADCYLQNRLERYKLLPGAVESYFRAQWRQYTDVEGKLKNLDETTQRQIRARILRAKQKDFATLEYERLCQKYHLVITEEAGLLQ